MTDTVTIGDLRDADQAARGIAAGGATIAEADMDAYLAAATPLQFWHRQRGLKLVALAAAIDVSQPYIGQLELGQRTGDVATLVRLAPALVLRVDDLVA